MASTITGAFEQIKGLALDMAIGLEKARPEPTPAEVDIEMAFSDFDIGTLDRMASTLAAACRSRIRTRRMRFRADAWNCWNAARISTGKTRTRGWACYIRLPGSTS